MRNIPPSIGYKKIGKLMSPVFSWCNKYNTLVFLTLFSSAVTLNNAFADSVSSSASQEHNVTDGDGRFDIKRYLAHRSTIFPEEISTESKQEKKAEKNTIKKIEKKKKKISPGKKKRNIGTNRVKSKPKASTRVVNTQRSAQKIQKREIDQEKSSVPMISKKVQKSSDVITYNKQEKIAPVARNAEKQKAEEPKDVSINITKKGDVDLNITKGNQDYSCNIGLDANAGTLNGASINGGCKFLFTDDVGSAVDATLGNNVQQLNASLVGQAFNNQLTLTLSQLRQKTPLIFSGQEFDPYVNQTSLSLGGKSIYDRGIINSINWEVFRIVSGEKDLGVVANQNVGIQKASSTGFWGNTTLKLSSTTALDFGLSGEQVSYSDRYTGSSRDFAINGNTQLTHLIDQNNKIAVGLSGNASQYTIALNYDRYVGDLLMKAYIQNTRFSDNTFRNPLQIGVSLVWNFDIGSGFGSLFSTKSNGYNPLSIGNISHNQQASSLGIRNPSTYASDRETPSSAEPTPVLGDVANFILDPASDTGTAGDNETTDTTPTFTWDSADNASGYEFSSDGGTSWTDIGNVVTYTPTLTDGTYTIQVRPYDAIGNRGNASSQTIKIDNVVATPFSLGIIPSQGVTYMNEVIALDVPLVGGSISSITTLNGGSITTLNGGSITFLSLNSDGHPVVNFTAPNDNKMELRIQGTTKSGALVDFTQFWTVLP